MESGKRGLYKGGHKKNMKLEAKFDRHANLNGTGKGSLNRPLTSMGGSCIRLGVGQYLRKLQSLVRSDAIVNNGS